MEHALTGLFERLGLDAGILRTKFGQNVIWNISSLAVLAVCGVMLNLIIARYYSPEVLGVFNRVYAIYMVFSQFAVLGIHLSVLKYVAQYSHQRQEYGMIFATGLLLALVFAAAATVVLWMTSGWFGTWQHSPGVAYGMRLAAAGLFFFSLNKVFLWGLNGLERMKLYAVLAALRYILIILVVLAIAVSGRPGSVLPVCFSIAEATLLLCQLPFVLPEMRRPTRAALQRWGPAHFSFGVRGFLSNVLLQLNTRVDVLMLGYFWNDRVVGIYSLAAILAEGISQLPVVFQTNYNPVWVKMLAEHQYEALIKRSHKAVRVTYAIMGVIGLGAILCYPAGMLLVKDQAAFLQSWPVFVILISGVVLGSGYVPMGNILLQAGRPGLHTIMVTAVVTFIVAGNLLLVPTYSLYGSALVMGLSFVLSAALVRLSSRWVLNLPI